MTIAPTTPVNPLSTKDPNWDRSDCESLITAINDLQHFAKDLIPIISEYAQTKPIEKWHNEHKDHPNDPDVPPYPNTFTDEKLRKHYVSCYVPETTLRQLMASDPKITSEFTIPDADLDIPIGGYWCDISLTCPYPQPASQTMNIFPGELVYVINKIQKITGNTIHQSKTMCAAIHSSGLRNNVILVHGNLSGGCTLTKCPRTFTFTFDNMQMIKRHGLLPEDKPT